MKALANGVLNATVADGWAKEVEWEGIGWVLDHTNISQSFYDTLENEIVPLYYDRDPEGLPQTWLRMMQQSINLSKQYSTERMLNEYLKKLYK
jgi:starch phosphorylase